MSSTSAASFGATIWTRGLKRALGGLALVAAAAAAAAASGSPSGVVLEYHHVAQDTPASTSVTPATFETHMDYLADNGYNVWPLPRLVAAVRAGESVPAKTVALTFDDAYRSVYETVWPRLRERGWPFTVFVTTSPIDQGKGHFVTWDQLREMAEGGATIANHSVNHPHMVRRRDGESREAWLERMRGEVTEAQQRLQDEIGDVPKLFAYPYGEFSPPIQALIEDLGYTGFGQQSGGLGPRSDFAALPRFPLATRFADIESFGIKVNARPLPVRRSEPASGIVDADTARPELRLTLEPGSVRPGAVNCFVSGRPAEIARSESDPPVITVRPASPISPGRTKYNCTAPPSDGGGGWHWYSFLWMKPLPDGSWYAD